MRLYVRVGLFSSTEEISPWGSSPSFSSAWKPLQIPSIKPSRCFRRSWTASVSRGLRKKEVMNLAEPSGSSPPEKPPGRNTIWAFLIACSSSWADWARAFGVRLRMTTVSASIPARRQARTESYSQFVPGNTGMTTFGRAISPLNTAGERRS